MNNSEDQAEDSRLLCERPAGDRYLTEEDKIIMQALLTAADPLQDQLIKSLFKSWQRHSLELESMAIYGRQIIQNVGHPDTPKLTTKDLIQYVTEMKARMNANFKETGDLVKLTVNYVKSHMMAAK